MWTRGSPCKCIFRDRMNQPPIKRHAEFTKFDQTFYVEEKMVLYKNRVSRRAHFMFGWWLLCYSGRRQVGWLDVQ